MSKVIILVACVLFGFAVFASNVQALSVYQVIQGGTGWGNIQAGTLLVGNGTDRLATTTLSAIFPFTTTTYGGTTVNATSTGLLLTGSPLSLMASSSVLTYASTTALTVSGNSYLGTVSSGVWNGTAIDISDYTNLTAGDGITLTLDDLDCDTASGSVFGCLSSTDWTTFNNKQDALSFPLTIAQGGTATTTMRDQGVLFYNSTLGTVSQGKNIAGNALNYDYTNGHLGIGTTTPGYSLSVYGDASFGGTASPRRRTDINTNGLFTFYATDNSLVDFFTMQNGGITAAGQGLCQQYNMASSTSSTLGIYFAGAQICGISEGDYTDATNALAGLSFYTSSVPGTIGERMRIDNAGDVGIGTTSPSNKLHVEGTNATLATLYRGTAASNVSIEFRNNTETWFAGQADSGVFAIDDDNNLGAAPLLTLTTGGALAVTSTVTGTRQQLELVSPREAITIGEYLARIGFMSNDTNLTSPGTTTAGFSAVAEATHTAATQPTSLIFTTTAAGGTATNTTKMTITGAGLVGIGTSTPPSIFTLHGSSPKETYYDTSTSQLRTFTGALEKTFTYSTTTAWTGTTTIPMGPAWVAQTFSGVKCFTDTGTLNVALYDGTNRANNVNASTTVGTISYTTNNTFTASEKRYIDVGTPASSPTSISCTFRWYEQ